MGSPSDGGRLPPAPVAVPILDDMGVLRNGDAWVSLSPVQEAIVRALIARFGHAVSRDDVAKAAWPQGGPQSHAINLHIHRLRPRLRELDLVIHTLRGRGFLLEHLAG